MPAPAPVEVSVGDALICLPETPDFVDNREFRGEVPEWLKGADCKSVGLRLRWFESNLLHHSNLQSERTSADAE